LNEILPGEKSAIPWACITTMRTPAIKPARERRFPRRVAKHADAKTVFPTSTRLDFLLHFFIKKKVEGIPQSGDTSSRYCLVSRQYSILLHQLKPSNMKKVFFLVLCCSLQVIVFGQKMMTTKSLVKGPKIYKKIPVNKSTYKFDSDNGNVTVSFGAGQPSKDEIVSSSTPTNAAMCLTKEEVKGQKVENELIIADGSKATQLLPGGVIDAEMLLKSGEFIYMKMDKRKMISLSTSSNLAKITSATVKPMPGNNIEDELRAKVHSLKRPSNLNGMPNIKSTSQASVSTLEEKMGLDIGASAFYMGISVSDNFSFSSEKYRYMYLYEFEQECVAVMANGISSPDDLFTEQTDINPNWLYVREVKYGRRLYVLIESEYDLEKYSNELNGSLNWGVVSAAYNQKNSGSTLSKKTNIRIITQGGQPVSLTDDTKLQATLDKYFAAGFNDIDIVPLSYKVTYMNGGPVSVVSKAFLNGNNCLEKSKVRVRVTKIEVDVADDGGSNEQLYGSAIIYLYNAAGKKVAFDGKTLLPEIPSGLFTGAISYAKEEAPLILKAGQPKEFGINEQGKYIDLTVSNLDMTIEVKPTMKEKDDFGDDTFMTDNKMKRSLRKMLIEGSTIQVFEFRHDLSKVRLTVEVAPLW
jgi:hypothetical protein